MMAQITHHTTLKETMKTIFYETDISSFEDFHDSDWVQKIITLVKGTDIEPVAEEFVSHWWGCAKAFVLPWLLVNGVYDSVYSAILFPPNKSRQDVWNEYLQHNEFKGALWKLAEGMYCSLYYAYENLVVNTLIKIKNRRIRVTDQDFKKVLVEVYGDKFTHRIWNDNFIAVSREIRNCIVHNVGKSSPRLQKMSPLPLIKKGNILISASDTRMLYNTLKPLAFEILSEVVGRIP